MSNTTAVDHPGPLPGSPPERTGAPRPAGLVAVLVLGAFGLYLASLAPQVVTMALRIAKVDHAHKTVALSTVLIVGAVVSIVSLPLFGALSDRTRGPFGRRRPWMVGGAVVGLVGLVVAGSVPSVAGIAVGWAIGSLGYGAAFAGFLPLIPEFVPEHLRARLSGLIGFIVAAAVLVGVVLGSVFVDVPLAMLALPGVVAVIAVLVVSAFVRDLDRSVAAGWPRFGARELLASYWVRTDGDRDFAWNWVSRLLVGLAYVGIQTYATFFLTDTVGLSTKSAAAHYATITAASTPVAVVCFLLAGWLSDRLRRRKAFVLVGALVLAAGLVVASVAGSVHGFLLAWLVVTVGQAVYLTVDVAIAAAVVPDPTSAGKAMSVYQVATLLPNVGAPLVAVVVLALSGDANYPAFFLVLAVLAVLSAGAVTFVRRIR